MLSPRRACSTALSCLPGSGLVPLVPLNFTYHDWQHPHDENLATIQAQYLRIYALASAAFGRTQDRQCRPRLAHARRCRSGLHRRELQPRTRWLVSAKSTSRSQPSRRWTKTFRLRVSPTCSLVTTATPNIAPSPNRCCVIWPSACGAGGNHQTRHPARGRRTARRPATPDRHGRQSRPRSRARIAGRW